MERVSRDLCEAVNLHPDKLVDGEVQWRGYVGMAVNATESWKVLEGG